MTSKSVSIMFLEYFSNDIISLLVDTFNVLLLDHTAGIF